jgi:hypothetical protein
MDLMEKLEQVRRVNGPPGDSLVYLNVDMLWYKVQK